MRLVLDGKLFVIYHSRSVVFFIRAASANCVVNFSLNSVFLWKRNNYPIICLELENYHFHRLQMTFVVVDNCHKRDVYKHVHESG